MKSNLKRFYKAKETTVKMKSQSAQQEEIFAKC